MATEHVAQLSPGQLLAYKLAEAYGQGMSEAEACDFAANALLEIVGRALQISLVANVRNSLNATLDDLHAAVAGVRVIDVNEQAPETQRSGDTEPAAAPFVPTEPLDLD